MCSEPEDSYLSLRECLLQPYCQIPVADTKRNSDTAQIKHAVVYAADGASTDSRSGCVEDEMTSRYKPLLEYRLIRLQLLERDCLNEITRSPCACVSGLNSQRVKNPLSLKEKSQSAVHPASRIEMPETLLHQQHASLPLLKGTPNITEEDLHHAHCSVTEEKEERYSSSESRVSCVHNESVARRRGKRNTSCTLSSIGIRSQSHLTQHPPLNATTSTPAARMTMPSLIWRMPTLLTRLQDIRDRRGRQRRWIAHRTRCGVGSPYASSSLVRREWMARGGKRGTGDVGCSRAQVPSSDAAVTTTATEPQRPLVEGDTSASRWSQSGRTHTWRTSASSHISSSTVSTPSFSVGSDESVLPHRAGHRDRDRHHRHHIDPVGISAAEGSDKELLLPSDLQVETRHAPNGMPSPGVGEAAKASPRRNANHHLAARAGDSKSSSLLSLSTSESPHSIPLPCRAIRSHSSRGEEWKRWFDVQDWTEFDAIDRGEALPYPTYLFHSSVTARRWCRSRHGAMSLPVSVGATGEQERGKTPLPKTDGVALPSAGSGVASTTAIAAVRVTFSPSGDAFLVGFADGLIWYVRSPAASSEHRYVSSYLGNVIRTSDSVRVRQAISSSPSSTNEDFSGGKASSGEEVLFGHTESITCFAFSDSGAEFASGSMDGSIILWRTATRSKLRRITLLAHPYTSQHRSSPPHSLPRVEEKSHRFPQFVLFAPHNNNYCLIGCYGESQLLLYNNSTGLPATTNTSAEPSPQYPTGSLITAVGSNAALVPFILTGSLDGVLSLWSAFQFADRGLPVVPPLAGHKREESGGVDREEQKTSNPSNSSPVAFPPTFYAAMNEMRLPQLKRLSTLSLGDSGDDTTPPASQIPPETPSNTGTGVEICGIEVTRMSSCQAYSVMREPSFTRGTTTSSRVSGHSEKERDDGNSSVKPSSSWWATNFFSALSWNEAPEARHDHTPSDNTRVKGARAAANCTTMVSPSALCGLLVIVGNKYGTIHFVGVTFNDRNRGMSLNGFGVTKNSSLNTISTTTPSSSSSSSYSLVLLRSCPHPALEPGYQRSLLATSTYPGSTSSDAGAKETLEELMRHTTNISTTVVAARDTSRVMTVACVGYNGIHVVSPLRAYERAYRCNKDVWDGREQRVDVSRSPSRDEPRTSRAGTTDPIGNKDVERCQPSSVEKTPSSYQDASRSRFSSSLSWQHHCRLAFPFPTAPHQPPGESRQNDFVAVSAEKYGAKRTVPKVENPTAGEGTNQKMHPEPKGWSCTSLCWSPDSEHLVVTTSNGGVYMWPRIHLPHEDDGTATAGLPVSISPSTAPWAGDMHGFVHTTGHERLGEAHHVGYESVTERERRERERGGVGDPGRLSQRVLLSKRSSCRRNGTSHTFCEEVDERGEYAWELLDATFCQEAEVGCAGLSSLASSDFSTPSGTPHSLYSL